MLHTEKQALQCVTLGILPEDMATVHSRAIQCNQAPYIAILRKSGKGRHVRGHAHHVARGALQMYGFPIQTHGITSNCHNFNSEA